MSDAYSLSVIASRDNPRYKALLKMVAQPRLLRKAGQAVAEGVHLLQELGRWPGVVVREVWFSSALREHREWPICESLLQGLGVDCVELPQTLYAQLSELEQGAGPLILFDTPKEDGTDTRECQTDILLLDGVQDPGNVGTIIRTAAAVGIAQVWTTNDCAWVWSGKVLRAAMGGHRHLRLCGVPDDGYARVKGWADAGVPVRLTRLEQSGSLFETDLRTPGVWLLGSEGKGVSPQWASLANQALRIPMQAGVESLNVASAASVCLYEQWRQRSVGGSVSEAQGLVIERHGRSAE
jgi:TrmH family RNA methyltransferase